MRSPGELLLAVVGLVLAALLAFGLISALILLAAALQWMGVLHG
jgi:hypothetical protein